MKYISFAQLRRLPADQKRLTLSTLFTLMRMAITPVIVITMAAQVWGMAFVLFVGAIFTDLLDGYTARLYNEQTFLGACLDPIADKVLLLSCFATLVFVHTPLLPIPLWFLCSVLLKDFLLVVGTAVLLLTQERFFVRPTLLGKVTTVVQMLFIVWLFTCYFFNWMPIKTYWLMLSLLLILVLASLLQYVIIGVNAIRNKNYA